MTRKILFILSISVTIYSCGGKETSSSKPPESNFETYHTDSDHKYEYRTGSSGNYVYNYDIVGEDENGNEVTGNVDMEGKNGTGTIVDDNGDEKEIEVEWIGYGEMEGEDEDGNSYTLSIE